MAHTSNDPLTVTPTGEKIENDTDEDSTSDLQYVIQHLQANRNTDQKVHFAPNVPKINRNPKSRQMQIPISDTIVKRPPQHVYKTCKIGPIFYPYLNKEKPREIIGTHYLTENLSLDKLGTISLLEHALDMSSLLKCSSTFEDEIVFINDTNMNATNTNESASLPLIMDDITHHIWDPGIPKKLSHL